MLADKCYGVDEDYLRGWHHMEYVALFSFAVRDGRLMPFEINTSVTDEGIFIFELSVLQDKQVDFNLN